jgi:malate dehydrogenase (oxaloacetate-decarboxylating)
MQGTTSVQYSFTLRLEIPNKPGMLGKITTLIGKQGGNIEAIDIVEATKNAMVRDITILTRNVDHSKDIVEKIKKLRSVKIKHVSDRVFLMHLGGKIHIQNKVPVNTRNALSMAYTPGVARVCDAIAEDPKKVWTLTIKSNSVAVVTDGSAVLGLGNIGPHAAMPVMEGKAMLFKEFANVDAYPVCLGTQDVEQIIQTVKNIAPGFGGINLEDISAPRCVEIEQRLRDELDIPVFHDDQHGTATVVTAAMINALKLVNKKFAEVKMVISGAGAAGYACTRMLQNMGMKNIIVCDRAGAIYAGRTEHMNPLKDWFAQKTNPDKLEGSIAKMMEGADIFLGVSGPGIIKPADLKKMGKNPIVFALANPTPEIMPEAAGKYVRIMATGRSDYPNQINNVLAFPGIFRGALDVRATDINDQMTLAAARAIAGIITENELSEEYIIPSVFNRQVAKAVADVVAETARQTGVARKK